MQKHFNAWESTRKNFIKLIDKYSIEELNTIPQGFKNNLIWNFGHVIVTQQLLCYKMSQNKPLISDEIIEQYRKGTFPPEHVGKGRVQMLKEFALSLIEQTKLDYANNLFQAYDVYQTSFGVELDSIDTAIVFNNVHEGLHLGYAMALKNALTQS